MPYACRALYGLTAMMYGLECRPDEIDDNWGVDGRLFNNMDREVHLSDLNMWGKLIFRFFFSPDFVVRFRTPTLGSRFKDKFIFHSFAKFRAVFATSIFRLSLFFCPIWRTHVFTTALKLSSYLALFR